MKSLMKRYVLPHRLLMLGIVLIAVLIPLTELLSVGMVIPILTAMADPQASNHLPGILAQWQSLFDRFDARAQLWVLCGVISVIAVLGFAVRLGFTLMLTRLQLRVNMQLKADMMSRVLNLDLPTFRSHKLADLHTFLGASTNTAGEMLKCVIRPLPAVFGMGLLLAVSTLISPGATALAACLIVVVGLLLRSIHGAQRQVGIRQRDQIKEVNHHSLDALQGYREIATFNRTQMFYDRLWNVFLELNETLRRKHILLGMVPGLTACLANLGLAIFLGVFLLIYGPDPAMILLFIAFFVILIRMLSYATQLLQVFPQVAVSYPVTQELMAFIDGGDLTEDVNDDGMTQLPFKDRIIFDRVTFQYDAAQTKALDAVSFTLPKGSRVGIVGVSGSGKSTLVDVLLKLAKPASGRVAIDDIDQAQAQTHAWREHFGVVPQDAFLFNATLTENIRFGDKTITQEQVEQAARLAMIHEHIASLPEGYDTLVGDRGARLSGGQRQRIAIARALANRRDILIFDEATSALDSLAETEVQKALQTLPEHFTLLLIAHRLTTLTHCDHLLVLDQGRLVEQGSIRELDALGGVFHQLSKEQGIDWARRLQSDSRIASTGASG